LFDRGPNDAPATGMVSAVRRLLGLLDDEGRETVLLPLDARQWRMWTRSARHAMWLNGYLGELTGAPAILGERSFNFTIFGEPSDQEPWGWQLAGTTWPSTA
jgi:hypothetical protein